MAAVLVPLFSSSVILDSNSRGHPVEHVCLLDNGVAVCRLVEVSKANINFHIPLDVLTCISERKELFLKVADDSFWIMEIPTSCPEFKSQNFALLNFCPNSEVGYLNQLPQLSVP